MTIAIEPAEEARAGSSPLTGLTAKAVAILVFAVLVAGVAARLVIFPIAAAAFDEEVGKRGMAMTSILAQHQELRLAFSLKDSTRARSVASEVLQGDADVRFVEVLDGEGKVLGKAGSDERDLPPIEIGQAGFAQRRQGDVQVFIRRVSRQAEANDLDFAPEPAPSGPQVLGTLVLGLSSASAQQRMATLTLTTLALAGLPLLVAFLIFFTRITWRLNRISRFAGAVATGDLGSTVHDGARDEIGLLARNLGAMTRRTAAMVARLQEASESLSRSSAEILASSTQQGQAASRQAASVSETGATVAELRETFRQTATGAQTVIDLAKRSEESTSTGRAAVQQSFSAMEEIRRQVVAIASTLRGLVNRTKQIASIIEVVNDLAEQSNVLALNAAIEAARAGEQGRGFAVVAREVRNLAERSKESTSQVRAILQDIEGASHDALQVVEEGSRKSQIGSELAGKAGDSIVLLDQAIDQSSTAAKQIAASIRQQGVGVEQIWQAMSEIDRTANETASGIRQLEGASRTMKALSDEMGQLVSQYRVARKVVD